MNENEYNGLHTIGNHIAYWTGYFSLAVQKRVGASLCDLFCLRHFHQAILPADTIAIRRTV